MTKNGKLFTKIGTAIVGIAMAIGVGVAASSGSAREARAIDYYSLASSISDGDEIIFVGIKNGDYYAMSATQGANNRQGVEVELSDEKISPSNSIAIFTVTDEGDAGLTFKDQNNKYIYNASGSKSYLRSVTSITNENTTQAHWTVSITAGVATIVSKSDTRPNMRFNTNGNDTPLFNCYASGQTDIYIYKKDTVDPNAPAVTITNGNKLAPHGSPVAMSAAITNDNSYTISWSASPAAGVTFSNATGENTEVTVANTVEAGTLITITATLNDSGHAADETCLVVTSKNPNSALNALTAGEAKVVLATNEANEIQNFYVKGYVSAYQGNENKGFWLSDAKDDTKTFEVYNGSAFDPIPSIGAYVVAHGKTSYYAQGTTSEITQGVIDSVDYLELSSTEVSVDMTQSVNLTVSNATGAVAWTVTSGADKVELSNQSNSGVTITGITNGSATVRATVGNASVDCAVTVNKYATDWTFVGIAMTVDPNTFKSTQYVGDELDKTGITVTYIEHSDTLGEPRETDVAELATYNFDSSAVKDFNLTATYNGHTTTEEIPMHIVVKPTTIGFGTAEGRIKIDAASKTGDDSSGNEWTITTVGTTSFTPTASYCQVGSASKPATSITFTTTLSEPVDITSFYADFGGFGDTAGTITLKIGDTTVGTGSLSGTDDVNVSANNQLLTTGSVLTVTVTSIAKGVKCYGIGFTYSLPDILSNELTITNLKNTFVAGEGFVVYTAGGAIKATYSQSGEHTVTENLTYTLNGNAIALDDIITKANDGQQVVVTYTDAQSATATKSYAISVNYAATTSLTLNHSSAEIGIGGNGLQLTGTVNQYADPNPVIDWESGDNNVATVDSTGKVTGVAIGNTTITGTVHGTEVSATCELTVSNNLSVSITGSSTADKFSGDEAVELVANISNFEGDITYEWTSNDNDVATVTKNANEPQKATVNFVGGGNAVITVTVTGSNGSKSAERSVSVTQSEAVLDPIASSDGNKLYLGTAKTSVTLSTKANITGNASNAVTWSSSNEDVATVENNGKVTAVAAGDATISATSSTGDVKTFDVKVLAPTGLKLISAPTKTSYAVGDTFDFMGLVVNATFNDETELELTAYNMSTPDMTKEGKQEITISSFGSTLKFEITISKVSYYKKLTNVSDLQSGDKLLLAAVKEDASKVATGISGTNKFLDVTDVTIANDKIEKTNAMEAYELILGGQEGAWTLGNSEGKVLGVTAAQSARLAWVDPTSETAHTWTIALQEDGTFEIAIVGIEGGALQYNSSSPRFTNYTTNQVKPLLFKLADSGDQPGPGPVAPTLSKIEIESMPTKTQYNIGDEFNQAGLSVKATYSDGSTKVISTGLTVTGFDSTAAGEKTLTVTYEGKTATFKVTVNDSTQPTTKTLAEINVRNTQDTYEYGQEIDKTKLTVTAVYSDGTSAPVTNYTLSGYNKNQSGQQTVTVSYSEGGVTKTATFTVTVGNQPTDPVETARQNALRELQSYVAGLGESNYSAENWARIQAYLQEAPEILAGLDTVERIEKYVTTFKNAMTAIPTIAEQEAAALADAKAVALAGLKEYYDSFDQSQYDEAGVAALTAAYNDGKDAIEAATTTDAIDAAVRSAKAAMDAVAKKPSAPARRCGGDIAATSIILSAIALAGAGLLVFKKRKED